MCISHFPNLCTFTQKLKIIQDWQFQKLKILGNMKKPKMITTWQTNILKPKTITIWLWAELKIYLWGGRSRLNNHIDSQKIYVSLFMYVCMTH